MRPAGDKSGLGVEAGGEHGEALAEVVGAEVVEARLGRGLVEQGVRREVDRVGEHRDAVEHLRDMGRELRVVEIVDADRRGPLRRYRGRSAAGVAHDRVSSARAGCGPR